MIINTHPKVIETTEAAMAALEAAGDLSAMPYYRDNEVLIHTDTHLISVWYESAFDEVKVAHTPVRPPNDDGPWTEGIPQ